MTAISDVNTFVKILYEKGYNGYFQTQGGHSGKLKESLESYFESFKKGLEAQKNNLISLSCYLQWKGEDKPRIECTFEVKSLNGKLFLSAMEVSRKDQFGQLLKQAKWDQLSIVNAPKAAEAIAMVSEIRNRKAKRVNRFKS